MLGSISVEVLCQISYIILQSSKVVLGRAMH